VTTRTPAAIYAEIRAVERQCVAELNANPGGRARCLLYAAMYDRIAVLWEEMNQAVTGDPDAPMWAWAATYETWQSCLVHADMWRDLARDAEPPEDQAADRSEVER